MNELFTSHGLSGLIALTFMEVMLGIDNVIFVSIILEKLPKEADKKKASTIWISAGMVVRIALLYILGSLINGEARLFSLWSHEVSLKDIIMVAGGLFLMVNTTLEIHNKLEGEDPKVKIEKRKGAASFASITRQIIFIDLIFSFDGIITSIGMAKLQIVRIIGVVLSMIVMFVFARKISNFIHKHPTFKMLALSFLILIAFTLIVDGAHVEAFEIPHGYVYFAMAFSFGVELLNMQIRRRLVKQPVILHEPVIGNEESDIAPD